MKQILTQKIFLVENHHFRMKKYFFEQTTKNQIYEGS
jgi:hypothetical protein